MSTFVAIDFETATTRHDSACAVGLAGGRRSALGSTTRRSPPTTRRSTGASCTPVAPGTGYACRGRRAQWGIRPTKLPDVCRLLPGPPSNAARGQARPFSAGDLAAVLATCHRRRRRGRGRSTLLFPPRRPPSTSFAALAAVRGPGRHPSSPPSRWSAGAGCGLQWTPYQRAARSDAFTRVLGDHRRWSQPSGVDCAGLRLVAERFVGLESEPIATRSAEPRACRPTEDSAGRCPGRC